ncbi:hypothetical protein [Lacrimispora sp.]|uniref:hypothetical protein n=1 Tax=Lacrimispora sp. TaxID=2719234 RepID=UPI002FDA9B32
MEVQSIWVSSVNHLTTFHSITTGTPFWRKLISRYVMPENFPMNNMYNFFRMPIVLISEGHITLDEKALKYTAHHEKSKATKDCRNLNSDLSFEIDYSDIQSIDLYKHNYASINHYNITWIRIVPKTNVLDQDILICVGGSGPAMSGIINNTHNLYEAILHEVGV